MIEKVIELFNRSGLDKIEFTPEIKLKMTPHTPVVWIDKIYKVRDQLMITVSTISDSTNMNLAAVDDKYLSSLNIRLYSMYGKTKTEPGCTQPIQ